MRKTIPFLIITVLLLSTSCLFVGTIDDEYEGSGYYASDGTYVEVIPKSSEWITSDATAVYITLDANATTGYEWQASVSGDSIYLDSQSYAAPAYTGLVGVGGTWNAKFETTGIDGVSYVTLRYLRPWNQSDVAYTITFSVTAYYGTVSSVSVISCNY